LREERAGAMPAPGFGKLLAGPAAHVHPFQRVRERYDLLRNLPELIDTQRTAIHTRVEMDLEVALHLRGKFPRLLRHLPVELGRHGSGHGEDIEAGQVVELLRGPHAGADLPRALTVPGAEFQDRALAGKRRLLADVLPVTQPTVDHEGIQPSHEDVDE